MVSKGIFRDMEIYTRADGTKFIRGDNDNDVEILKDEATRMGYFEGESRRERLGSEIFDEKT